MQNISESLRRQREQILTDGSEESLSRHSSLLEIAVISLYNRLANRLNLDAEQFRSSGAVLATGSFSRGLLGPGQPVPLLFLKAESLPGRESWLEEIVSPLEEAGWVVEAIQGTPARLMEEARGDFHLFLRLLDTRFISGNRVLADELDKALEAYVEERRDDLLARLRECVLSREAMADAPEHWQEPDLYQGRGSLADISAIRAACRIAGNITSLEDAIFRGYLTRAEVDHLVRAEKAYARLLSLLRDFSPDAGGLLRFESQEWLATKLRYSERSGYLPVETFMQQLYQLCHAAACVSREFWERLEESRAAESGGEEGATEVLETGVLARSGKICLQTEKYPATAGYLVHLFSLAARHDLGFANVTRQWIGHHRNVLDTASGDAAVKEEILQLIRFDSSDLRVVRIFYDQGLLTSLIPELAAVHGLVQHDNFHLYPVHEHHLRTLRELKRLCAGDYSEEEPELTRIAQGLEDPVWLFLSGLLHDIGKSSGTKHAARGGEMIPAVAHRLGLSPEEAETVQFLVSEHLLLTNSASLRDLGDQEMLSQCALAVRTQPRLDQLALLSFADMAATGPKAAQKWKDTPTVSLYEKVLHLLEKGEPSPDAIAEKIDCVRAQVERELADLMDSGELEAYVAQLAPRYLLSMSPSAIARHLRLGWQLQHSEEPFIWEVAVKDGEVESILICNEMPGLLSRSAGILTLHNLNIRGAQIFAMNDAMILLIYQCRLPEGAGKGLDWNSVREHMKRLLRGKIALDYRIAAHAASRGCQPLQLRPTPSRILVDNNSSGRYTILEVYTVDRVGLLYTISRTLFELQIRIYVAKITTKVDQVADVFYVKTRQGEKVTDPEQIEEIKSALLYWLDGPGGVA